jgi:hypothetical protein
MQLVRADAAVSESKLSYFPAASSTHAVEALDMYLQYHYFDLRMPVREPQRQRIGRNPTPEYRTLLDQRTIAVSV